MLKRVIEFFRLTNKKRFVVLVATIFSTIFVTFFSGLVFVQPNAKLGIEYAGGYEYVIEIDPGLNEDNVEESNRIANDVAEEIYNRIDAFGNAGVIVEAELRSDQNATVRVQIPDIKNDDEREEYERLITEKPALTMTDTSGNPLFNNSGRFDSNHFTSGASNQVFVHGDIETFNFKQYSKTPILSGGASVQTNQDGQKEVLVKLDDPSLAFYSATAHMSAAGEPIVMWLDLDAFIEEAANEWNNQWLAAQKNPYMFAYVEENPENILKEHQIDAQQYLVSVANVQEALAEPEFVISGNFSSSDGRAEQLARAINYGVSTYNLNTLTSNFVDSSYGASSFNRTVIAGFIVFALIAVFLIWNYGLLGVLSSISIGLFVMLTLTSFTIMAGVYTPEAIAALIIGIGMSVDANIITFERLKTEFYAGNSLKKANRKANKKSLTTILDSNITTAIVAFVLFYFGTRSIIGLSVTLILSIFFTLVIMLGLTRLMTTMLINSEKFKDKPGLFGMRKSFDQKLQTKIDSVDYIKSAKWFSRGSLAIIGIGTITMSIMSLMSMSFGASFNLSQEFAGGTIVQVSALTDGGVIDDQHENDARSILENHGVAISEIDEIYNDDGHLTQLRVNVRRDLEIEQIRDAFASEHGVRLYVSNTTTDVAKQLVKDAILAILIAFALVVVYTLIRFSWTFAFAAIIALVHDGLIITAVFIITRVEVSPVFVAALLSVIGYSINDTIVTFDRIREKMHDIPGDLDNAKVKRIANTAIRDTLKRSLMTSITTISAILILMSFGNATRFTFNFAMLIGLVSGTYSSIFIASSIWVKLELWRLKRQKIRIKNKFWAVNPVEEQTFIGINEYQQ